MSVVFHKILIHVDNTHPLFSLQF